jgi:CheY-like chemotaxis protein
MTEASEMRPLILVAEDDPDVRDMYCVVLSDAGFAYAEAATGQDALRLARQLGPAVVVMDATMPGALDGWAATAAIRADPALWHIPVIMLTGHAFPRHRQRAAEIGAAAFVAKPALPETLVRAIRTCLDSLNT